MGCSSSIDAAAAHCSDSPFNGFWVRRSDGEECIIDGKMFRSRDGLYATVDIQKDRCIVVFDDRTQPVELCLRHANCELFCVHDAHAPEYTFDRCAQSAEFAYHDQLEASIRNGDVTFLRGSYFERCWQQDQCFESRKHIPEADKWNCHDVIHNWRKYGRLFVVVVSYAWLSADHPDPERFHLRRLARIVRELKSRATLYGLDEIAIAIDFTSLGQCEFDCRDLRTDSYRRQFVTGLDSFNALYVHPDVTSVKLTATPRKHLRAYNVHGWLFLESIVIDAKPGHVNNRLSFGPSFDPDQVVSHGQDFVNLFSISAGKRHPPLTLEKFEKELEVRSTFADKTGLPLFTDGSDYKVLSRKYVQLMELVRTADTLAYESCEWTDAEVFTLCEWLPATRICTLKLRHNAITNAAMAPLVTAILSTRTLKCLWLDDNQIGAGGAEQLAHLVQNSHGLRHLDIKKNPLCESPDAVGKIREAWRASNKHLSQKPVTQCEGISRAMRQITKHPSVRRKLRRITDVGSRQALL